MVFVCECSGVCTCVHVVLLVLSQRLFYMCVMLVYNTIAA